MRETLRFFLEKIDPEVNVAEARTFAEALEAAGHMASLDLIILDLKMPGMNRFAGLKLMRQRFPNVPTVIISGFVGRDDVMEAIQNGAAGVIPKTWAASRCWVHCASCLRARPTCPRSSRAMPRRRTTARNRPRPQATG